MLLGNWDVWLRETPEQRWQRKVDSIETLAELRGWRDWPLPPEVEPMLIDAEERLLRAEIARLEKAKGRRK